MSKCKQKSMASEQHFRRCVPSAHAIWPRGPMLSGRSLCCLSGSKACTVSSWGGWLSQPQASLAPLLPGHVRWDRPGSRPRWQQSAVAEAQRRLLSWVHTSAYGALSSSLPSRSHTDTPATSVSPGLSGLQWTNFPAAAWQRYGTGMLVPLSEGAGVHKSVASCRSPASGHRVKTSSRCQSRGAGVLRPADTSATSGASGISGLQRAIF